MQSLCGGPPRTHTRPGRKEAPAFAAILVLSGVGRGWKEKCLAQEEPPPRLEGSREGAHLLIWNTLSAPSKGLLLAGCWAPREGGFFLQEEGVGGWEGAPHLWGTAPETQLPPPCIRQRKDEGRTSLF